MTSSPLLPLIIPLLISSTGLASILLYRKQLIVALIYLEVIALGLFISLTLILSSMELENYTPLFLITLSACEATLGLALLTSLLRTHGNDLLNSLNLSQC